MKILCDYRGWVKMQRMIFKTPIWNDPAAFRIYAALLAAATHMEILETVNGVPVRLRPGQLTATQSEICRITGCSRKMVRNGLDLLSAEGMVSCHCAPDRKFSIMTVHSPPRPINNDETATARPGPTHFEEPGQSLQGYNANEDNGSGTTTESPGAGRFFENGPILYKDREYRESKNGKNILSSSPSIVSILSLWRDAKDKAGEPYCEDPVTLEGAGLMARLWLDTGRATEPVIAAAMARFAHVVKTNEAARLYTLKTLANSLGTYLEKPSEAVIRRYSWTFTCDVCGYTTASFHRANETPKPYRCRLNPGGDCAGTMIPKRD